MAQIHLRKLILSNFRSFVGKHEFDFQKSGLVMIRGTNKDSQGESGAGKSTVILAITYGLGFAPYSAKDLQSWHTEDLMSVELHMDTDQGPAILKRGEKLSLTVDGVVTKGSAKAVEERLDQLCGVGKDLRRALTYREQGRPGLFMSMSDTELKEFLTDVLNIDWLEKEIDKRVGTLPTLEAKAKHADEAFHAQVAAEANLEAQAVSLEVQDTAALQSINTELEISLKAAKTQKVAKQEDLKEYERIEQAERDAILHLRDEEIRGLENKLNGVLASQWQEAPNSVVTELLTKIEQCKDRIQKLTTQEKERMAEFERASTQKRTEMDKFTKKAALLPGLKENLEEYEADLISAMGNKCPTCEQEWLNNQEQIVKLSNLIDSVKVKIKEASDAEIAKNLAKQEYNDMKFVFNPTLEKLQKILEGLRNEVATENGKSQGEAQLFEADKKAKVASIKQQISSIQGELNDAYRATLASDLRSNTTKEEVRILDEDIERLRDRLAKSTQILNDVKNSNNMALMRWEQQKIALNTAQEKRQKAFVASEEATKEYNLEYDYYLLLKGFRDKIFDEVLEEIGSESTNILGGLPNTAHISLQFKSERTTAKGTSRSMITPVAYFHGEERPLRSGCSGGMFTSVELAVDMAVSQVVSRRIGCNLGLLMLDESFNGHDQITKESCLEILQKNAMDKLVLVIDHGNVFQEAFSDVINITYENGKSAV